MRQVRLVQAVRAVAAAATRVAIADAAGTLEALVDTRNRLLQAALQCAEEGGAALHKLERQLDSDQTLLVQLRELMARWEHSPLLQNEPLPHALHTAPGPPVMEHAAAAVGKHC